MRVTSTQFETENQLFPAHLDEEALDTTDSKQAAPEHQSTQAGGREKAPKTSMTPEELLLWF